MADQNARVAQRPATLRRLASSDRVASAVLGTVGVVIAICLLELMTKSGLVQSRDVPPAFDIIRQFFENLGTAHFWHVIGDTMYQFSIGLAIAILIGIPLGLAIGASDSLWRALRPTIEFLRPVPPVAFLALLFAALRPHC